MLLPFLVVNNLPKKVFLLGTCRDYENQLFSAISSSTEHSIVSKEDVIL